MENANKLQIRKNDIVKVITGREKGKVGRVLKIDREKGRVFVEELQPGEAAHEARREDESPGRDRPRRGAAFLFQRSRHVRQVQQADPDRDGGRRGGQTQPCLQAVRGGTSPRSQKEVKGYLRRNGGWG